MDTEPPPPTAVCVVRAQAGDSCLRYRVVCNRDIRYAHLEESTEAVDPEHALNLVREFLSAFRGEHPR